MDNSVIDNVPFANLEIKETGDGNGQTVRLYGDSESYLTGKDDKITVTAKIGTRTVTKEITVNRTRYTVSFETGIDGYEIPSQMLPYGEKADRSKAAFDFDGYIFQKWVREDGGEEFDFENTPITSDLTLKAVKLDGFYFEDVSEKDWFEDDTLTIEVVSNYDSSHAINPVWYSSDDTIATVDSSGNVEFCGNGRVTISARLGNFVKSMTFDVKPTYTVTYINESDKDTIVSSIRVNEGNRIGEGSIKEALGSYSSNGNVKLTFYGYIVNDDKSLVDFDNIKSLVINKDTTIQAFYRDDTPPKNVTIVSTDVDEKADFTTSVRIVCGRPEDYDFKCVVVDGYSKEFYPNNENRIVIDIDSINKDSSFKIKSVDYAGNKSAGVDVKVKYKFIDIIPVGRSDDKTYNNGLEEISISEFKFSQSKTDEMGIKFDAPSSNGGGVAYEDSPFLEDTTFWIDHTNPNITDYYAVFSVLDSNMMNITYKKHIKVVPALTLNKQSIEFTSGNEDNPIEIGYTLANDINEGDVDLTDWNVDSQSGYDVKLNIEKKTDSSNTLLVSMADGCTNGRNNTITFVQDSSVKFNCDVVFTPVLVTFSSENEIDIANDGIYIYSKLQPGRADPKYTYTIGCSTSIEKSNIDGIGIFYPTGYIKLIDGISTSMTLKDALIMLLQDDVILEGYPVKSSMKHTISADKNLSIFKKVGNKYYVVIDSEFGIHDGMFILPSDDPKSTHGYIHRDGYYLTGWKLYINDNSSYLTVPVLLSEVETVNFLEGITFEGIEITNDEFISAIPSNKIYNFEPIFQPLLKKQSTSQSYVVNVDDLENRTIDINLNIDEGYGSNDINFQDLSLKLEYDNNQVHVNGPDIDKVSRKVTYNVTCFTSNIPSGVAKVDAKIGRQGDTIASWNFYPYSLGIKSDDSIYEGETKTVQAVNTNSKVTGINWSIEGGNN